MVAPNKLAHIVFRTNQLEQMTQWYCNVLEARTCFGSDKIAFLTYDDEHHRIALVAAQPYAQKAPSPSVGFYHSAFAYDDLGQLLDIYDRLKADGVLPWRLINHGLTISLYYRDPDGNDVELQVDRFDTSEEATRWMQGEAFARNPIGIELDPELLRADYRSGKPKADIMRRPDE
jgi:catechol-2,3-dioxygenase